MLMVREAGAVGTLIRGFLDLKVMGLTLDGKSLGS